MSYLPDLKIVKYNLILAAAHCRSHCVMCLTKTKPGCRNDMEGTKYTLTVAVATKSSSQVLLSKLHLIQCFISKRKHFKAYVCHFLGLEYSGVC